ncbi:MAG: HDOD domain-containing protein [Pseudomonadales bacterium]|nr:HDOD domain-containing protein [Pseudomonadales bacterium]
MTHTPSKEDIHDALRGITIPAQPQILVDIQIEQANPQPDLRYIANLISRDPGLAGSILKVVNSPFFGMSKTITDINHAAEMLGMTMLVNILTGISIKGSMSDGDIVALGNFWDSAIDIAQTMSALAKKLRLRQTDEAYVLGLFHNCGIPLLLQKYPDYLQVLQKSYQNPDNAIVDTEFSLIKTHHAVIGYYVARSWHLPPHLCDIINRHHHADDFLAMDDPASPDAKRLLAILKMAEHMCETSNKLGQQKTDHEWNRIHPVVFDILGIHQDRYENLREDIMELGT